MHTDFEFTGWKFSDSGLVKTPNGDLLGCITLEKDVKVPHESYRDGPSYHTYDLNFTREQAAVWLIAYWYERKLGLYPNLNFRNACMEAINASI